jgi:hypothetical protein
VNLAVSVTDAQLLATRCCDITYQNYLASLEDPTDQVSKAPAEARKDSQTPKLLDHMFPYLGQVIGRLGQV